MSKAGQTPKRDGEAFVPGARDTPSSLSDALRQARSSRQLTQQELARRLGLRQRQISDLERATVDPRLSTIQNVARALDLDVMLIPRHLISTVEGLQRAGSDAAARPMYALGEEDTEPDADEQPHEEVGGNGESQDSAAPGRRLPKEPK